MYRISNSKLAGRTDIGAFMEKSGSARSRTVTWPYCWLALMARLLFSGGIGIFFTMIDLPDIHHLPGLP